MPKYTIIRADGTEAHFATHHAAKEALKTEYPEAWHECERCDKPGATIPGCEPDGFAGYYLCESCVRKLTAMEQTTKTET